MRFQNGQGTLERSLIKVIGYFEQLLQILLARAVGLPVSRRSSGRLATTFNLVVTINNIIFSFFLFSIFCFSVVYFFIEGVLVPKHLFSES